MAMLSPEYAGISRIRPARPPSATRGTGAGYMATERSNDRTSGSLADLFQQRVHVEEIPDLGELAAVKVIASELGNRHPATGRLNSLESPQVGAGDREVHNDVVVVDNDLPHLPLPVREGGNQGRELRRNGGWLHRGVIDFDGRCIERRH